MKKPEQSKKCCPDDDIVDFEHISHCALVFQLLTFSMYFFSELDECNKA